jgi:hypothetical protein
MESIKVHILLLIKIKIGLAMLVWLCLIVWVLINSNLNKKSNLFHLKKVKAMKEETKKKKKNLSILKQNIIVYY